MYEAGWGKHLSYVFAFGAHEAVDVARRSEGEELRALPLLRLGALGLGGIDWPRAADQSPAPGRSIVR